MPLTINVGLSRKASKDYQSTGYSINVTAELDQALLAKPDELQAQIDGLYAQAENALARQVVHTEGTANPQPSRANGDGYNGRLRGNGSNSGQAPIRNGTANGHSNTGGMTAAQRKAIESIARRGNLDPEQEAHDQFGLGLGDLSIKQASELIDLLKDQAPVRNGDLRR